MFGFEETDLLLLIKLILAHCISDFALQHSSWVEERTVKKHKSKYLLLHTAITGLVVQVLVQNWLLSAIIMVTHYFIDLGKAYTKPTTRNFILDQALHLTVIGVTWLYFVGGNLNFGAALNNYKLMVYLTGYFIVTYPFGIVIKICTQKWRQPARANRQAASEMITPGPTEAEWDDLQEAGRWIGILERLLIVTFVLTDHYDAIGLLIAGKSIIHFKESDKKKSEYFLFGTMLSIGLSIFVGLGIKMLVM
jgi:hypothetical protein